MLVIKWVLHGFHRERRGENSFDTDATEVAEPALGAL